MNTASIVQKLWNYCNVLRDDGMSYGDYVEQLALTPALSQGERGKESGMADERSRPPCNQVSPVLAGYDWKKPAPSLALPRKRERGFSWGDELFDHYRHTLEELGKPKGLLGLIFTKSQHKFDSAKPRCAEWLCMPPLRGTFSGVTR